MNKNIKQDWLKALRSGGYKQGESFLRSRDDEFCCLGVLCDLHSTKKGGRWLEEGDCFSYEEHVQTELPPESVAEWAGLSEPNPEVSAKTIDIESREYIDLAYINDAGYTFEEIADIIEENL